jgi:hypothetical protein
MKNLSHNSPTSGRDMKSMPPKMNDACCQQLGCDVLRRNVLYVEYISVQRGLFGGPRATSGLSPLVTRPAKVFVYLLLVITSSFIF